MKTTTQYVLVGTLVIGATLMAAIPFLIRDAFSPLGRA